MMEYSFEFIFDLHLFKGNLQSILSMTKWCPNFYKRVIMSSITKLKAVCVFGNKTYHAENDVRNTVMFRGYNLGIMTSLGIPGSLRFTIHKDERANYYQNGKVLSEDLIDGIIISFVSEVNELRSLNRRIKLW